MLDSNDEEIEPIEGVHSDFIGIYENLIPSEVCAELINEFERFKSVNRVYAGSIGRGVVRSIKHSLDANFLTNPAAMDFVSEHVYPLMQRAYVDYTNKYPILTDGISPHEISAFQVQKYNDTGGGYHVFHTESGNPQMSHRVVTWALYLNDITQGGETEFLYQKIRLQPTVGTLTYFPTGYTHPHRGNPVLGDETKYLATGWLSYI